jgi:predicted phosphoribosyltransferase
MNNMSSYIINEFERRNDKYRKDRSIMNKHKKCSEFMSKFDERIKSILEGDKSLDSFTVGFPSECNKEVKKYLKDNSFDINNDKYDNLYKENIENIENNRILFRYNAGKNSISAMLFKSCIDPVNL